MQTVWFNWNESSCSEYGEYIWRLNLKFYLNSMKKPQTIYLQSVQWMKYLMKLNHTLMIANNWHWHFSIAFHQLTYTQCLGADRDNNRYAQIEVS